MSIKFLSGGGYFGFWGGGADFIFVGVRIFLILGGSEMTIILSDSDSRILTSPQSDPLEGGRGVIVQNYCHCISWENATTIKMRLSKMLFFLCVRPTIKFQGGSPDDPLFEPPATPPPLLTRALKNCFYRHFGVSEFS